MTKNKHYFLRIAILKTMASGCFYLLMPLAAKFYHQYVGSEYVGYTIFGSGVMILGNIILLVRAWALAFDKDLRKSYLTED
jgi:hypothetical protein